MSSATSSRMRRPFRLFSGNQRASPPANDGNSTDDSGIDSISHEGSKAHLPPADGVPKRKSLWKKELTLVKPAAASDDADGSPNVKATVSALETKFGTAGAKDLKQLNQLIHDTGNLLRRNSHLRASLTIATKDAKMAFVIPPTPKQVRKASMKSPKLKPKNLSLLKEFALDSKATPASCAANNKSNAGKNNNNHTVAPAPADSAFQRHNPARKPVQSQGASSVRRSARLAPKTVSNLKSKFETKPENAKNTVGLEQDLKKIKPREVSKIISSLNRLEEEAAKDTAVLRRSLRRKAVATMQKANRATLGDVDQQTMAEESPVPEIVTKKAKSPEEQIQSEPSPSVSPVVTPEVKGSTEKYLQQLRAKLMEDSESVGYVQGSALGHNGYYYQQIGSEGYDDVGNVNSHKYLDIDGDKYVDLAGYGKDTNSVHTYLSIKGTHAEPRYEDVGSCCAGDDEMAYSSCCDDDSCENDSNLAFVVTAKPAIVVNDSEDDEDCKTNTGSIATGLYESIAGSLLNLASKVKGQRDEVEDIYSICDPKKKASKSSANEAMLHYGISRLSEATSSGLTRSSIPSLSGEDEWIDIETDDWDTEEEDDAGVLQNKEVKKLATLERNQSFLRTSGRMSRRSRGAWQNRSARRPQVNWSDAVMTLHQKQQKEAEIHARPGDEDLYESIYEVINPPDDDESEFDEIIEEEEILDENGEQKALPPKPLSKFAEAAGKKMRKLRRNWSLKKNDISRSLSRIRRPSARPSIEGLLRRKTSAPASTSEMMASKGGADLRDVIRCQGTGSGSEPTMFYITLNIEDVQQEDKQQEESQNKAISQAIEGSSSSSSSVISSPGSSLMLTKSPVIVPSGGACRTPSRSKLTGSNSSHYMAVTRPTEAPPAPPAPPASRGSVNKDFCSSESSSSSGPDPELDPLEETYTSSLFQTEPLYQFYDKEIIQNAGSTSENMYECVRDAEEVVTTANTTSPQSTTDNAKANADKMAVVTDNNNTKPSSLATSPSSVSSVSSTASLSSASSLSQKRDVFRRSRSRCSAMDLVQKEVPGRRSMWGELPEVMESGVLDTISLEEKTLQEALFEVISSEASYLKSLNVLISHFAQNPRLIDTLTKRDYRLLFSDVAAVRTCSEHFLSDLESRWQESVMLSGICSVVKEHAEKHFGVYVKYCSNQVYQDRILKKLISENTKFTEILKDLESSSVCQSLAMHSFLMLPMQRITRLPLLVDAIKQRLDPIRDTDEHEDCQSALNTLNKLVQDCNESARSMGRMEELLILSGQLDFREVRRAVPLISASRWLVRRGEVQRLWWKENSEQKLTFGRAKVQRQTLQLFLFTDMLVLAKKKSDDNYLVVDHCPRNLVTLAELDSANGIPGGAKSLNAEQASLAWLTLLQNHESKTIEWLVNFSCVNDRSRWLECVSPTTTTSDNPEEKIYEEWDCPKVEATQSYQAQDSDEVDLKEGDTANVLRKLSDTGLNETPGEDLDDDEGQQRTKL